MSSFKNAIPRRAHKERSQPHSRRKFGLLEKHKDYVLRAQAFHKKEEALRKLKEKAAFKNPDEFYFKMIKTRTEDGVHVPESEANKYSPEELMVMKTQDIGYILQKIQSEKKKIEKLSSSLHSLDNRPPSKHIYYAEDRSDLIVGFYVIYNISIGSIVFHSGCLIACSLCRKMASSYRELEDRKNRLQGLEKLYMDMALQKELQQKKGRKRKLRDDEKVCPTSKRVYKWFSERKR
ncbi:putative U3 small nucleolar RNA-associated protein 11 [Acorus gramineus]|uniref:U3 small nucleolar RNA-associated protein 11 n=1 Tax=Acorus gramineus TaxID=55184 RepID=A0AAV9BWK0_ACOGR|nr:putative U3 small nucleolar RNA-associated protein 11 [Acorus gramineus]